MDVYDPWFNIYKVAGSPIGHKKSKETKRKISETEKKNGYKNHLGHSHTEESKQKMRESWRLKKLKIV